MDSNTHSELNLKSIENVYNNTDNLIANDLKDQFDRCFAACQLVANTLNITLKKPRIKTGIKFDKIEYLYKIAEINHFRIRGISLKPGWEKQDLGSFVADYKGELAALIKNASSHYILFQSTEQSARVVTQAIANDIDSHALVFYAALPDKKMSAKDIFKFTFSRLKKEILKVFILQIFISTLFLLIPVFTGELFDHIVPNANLSLLLQITIILIINFLVISLINLSLSIILLRLRIKAEYKLQAGLWDRLLRLPLHFFKQFTAGDLSYRMNSVTEIQHLIGTQIILAVIRGILSIISLGLMFYCSVRLSIAAIFLVAIIAVIVFSLTHFILKQENQVIEQRSKINGLLIELVNSIIKLRVANKEKEGFQLWLKEFAKITKCEIKSNKYKMSMDIFNVGFIGVCTLIVYALVIYQGTALSFGSFIIFNSAFTQFFAAVMLMIHAMSDSLQAIPLFNRSRPIFEALPEEKAHQVELGEIDGHISIKNVTFRYEVDADPLLKNFSLEILPGKFTAIVGASGSGKSTIFRLLLGLEQPESGKIFYSGIDLDAIRVQSLRQQLGVVMKSTQVIPGTIYDNIAGQRYGLTREQAWEIAEKVGIADMIHKLPMGMDTLINDGIQTLSGGEMQLLNLTRVIASQPKILLLDEATSALDNQIQDTIQNYLKQMKITQVVIAHRFSTIIGADIIHVMKQGQCVESGSYEELMLKKAEFFQLAHRQF